MRSLPVRRPTGRAAVSAAAGVVAAVGAVVLGAQLVGGSPQGASGSAPQVAVETATRPDVARDSVSAADGGDAAASLQTPLLALVTPPPPPPPVDRTRDRASRSESRSPVGSSGSGRSSGGTRPPPSGGGGSLASQVISLVNAARADAGCGALSPDGALTAAAQGHSADMAANDYFSHTSQDGRSFSDRIRAAGYSGGAIAENLAAGQSSASSVMASWMGSSGHRANILNCSYRYIGVGVASGGSFGTYWTQNFGG